MVEETRQFDRTPEQFKERRVYFERISSRFPVKFKDTRQDFDSDVFLHNVSAEGAKIVTSEQLFLNDKVSLEVEIPDGKNPMTLRGEVVWTKRLNAEVWDVGIKFHKVVFMDLWRIYESSQVSTSV